ncbi:MAG: hypothetical protein WGN25_06285 [Candidatus Electrothrix sp. GW3-4]|uniref:hypothetical protein n=1 Tax=Candidatus Electrothrix sp. GW3-4 TaxID=3126740 RepID=UPI0030D38EF9
MKKLVVSATLALLMPFTAAVYAADAPQDKADIEKMALQFEKKAEEDAKNELKRLVQEETLKKDLAAARGQQGGNQEAAPAKAANEAVPVKK